MLQTSVSVWPGEVEICCTMCVCVCVLTGVPHDQTLKWDR